LSSDTTNGSNDEARRVEVFYRKHLSSHTDRRWSRDNRGNQAILVEREQVLRDLLQGALSETASGLRVLEIGCGSGSTLLSWRERFAGGHTLVGVDLLQFRLAEAQRMNADGQFVCAGGDRLPFRADSFDVVLAYTLFSSVLSDRTARGISDEVDRVLKPGGLVVIYDFRVRRPTSRGTRAVRLHQIVSWFPAYSMRAQQVTVFPPLARHLAFLTAIFYGWLRRLPALLTHNLVLLAKPMPSSIARSNS
jgi:ubiquinone/menaquinone biosynthesis C-methylase UbiE